MNTYAGLRLVNCSLGHGTGVSAVFETGPFLMLVDDMSGSRKPRHQDLSNYGEAVLEAPNSPFSWA